MLKSVFFATHLWNDTYKNLKLCGYKAIKALQTHPIFMLGVDKGLLKFLKDSPVGLLTKMQLPTAAEMIHAL